MTGTIKSGNFRISEKATPYISFSMRGGIEMREHIKRQALDRHISMSEYMRLLVERDMAICAGPRVEDEISIVDSAAHE